MNKTDDNLLISVQVILKPESGEEFDPAIPVTSENVQSILPSAESLLDVQKFFVENNLDVSQAFANSFAVSGSLKTFEEIFAVKLAETDDGEIRIGDIENDAGYEIPLENLPPQIKKSIQTITFTAKPDFGPENFG